MSKDAGNEDVIVVGVDDSPEARSALRWAAQHARDTRATLRVVHGFEPRHVAGMLGMAKLQPDNQWRLDAESALADLVAEEIGTELGIDVEVIAAPGAPVQAVLNESEDANVLVVGSRGRGRAASVLLGSISGAILDRARCPVVVVPPDTQPKGSATREEDTIPLA